MLVVWEMSAFIYGLYINAEEGCYKFFNSSVVNVVPFLSRT